MGVWQVPQQRASKIASAVPQLLRQRQTQRPLPVPRLRPRLQRLGLFRAHQMGYCSPEVHQVSVARPLATAILRLRPADKPTAQSAQLHGGNIMGWLCTALRCK